MAGERLGIVLRVIVYLVMAGTIVYMVIPVCLAAISSFDPRPYMAYIWNIPYLSLTWYYAFIGNIRFMNGLLVSFALASTAAVLSASMGIGTAYAMVRHRFPGKEAIVSLFLSPLIVPAVVTGFGMLNYFAFIGLIDTFSKLVVAHVILTFPYPFRTVTAALVGFDRSLEEASMNLGADEITTFRRIILPIIKPAVVAGALFAFAVSLDDIPASIFLVSPVTTTLPVALFETLRAGWNPAIGAASVLLTVFSILFMVALDRTAGLEEFVGIGAGASP